jgi:hypothetical protein
MVALYLASTSDGTAAIDWPNVEFDQIFLKIIRYKLLFIVKADLF